MLHEFITRNREEIIARCYTKVATRSVPPPTSTDIDHGVPEFLDQLVAALSPNATANTAIHTNREINDSASRHGHDLLMQGLTVSQVVHGYGDICQSITELALETAVPISTEDFHTLNRCLDDAIAGAVSEYGRERIEATLATVIGAALLPHAERTYVSTAAISASFNVAPHPGITPS